MSPDGIHYYIVGASTASITTPCGNSMTFPSGSGYYMMATDWQNACLWTHEVPANLGNLYFGQSGELRFRNWFTAPIQFADTLYALEPGAMLVDGAFDQIDGVHDGHVLARARYQQYGFTGPGNAILRDIDHLSRAVLAVSVRDSVQLGGTTMVAPTPRVLLAVFDEEGSLSDTVNIADGVVTLGSFDMDALGNAYVTGECESCVVGGEEVDGSNYAMNYAPFLARIPQPNGLRWTYQPEPAYSVLSMSVSAAKPNRLILSSEFSSFGWPPGVVSYGSSMTQLDSTGAAIHAPVWVASSSIGIGMPKGRIDAQGNVVISAYYVGSNPDQRIMSIDSLGNVLWGFNLDQGANLFGLGIHPVDTMTYLLFGRSEGSQTFGPYALSPPANNMYNLHFTAKLADFNVSAQETTRRNEGAAAWPNPTSDQLTVQLHAAAPLRILDAQGRIVQQAQGIVGLNTIDVHELRPGPYAITAGELVTRFVKE